MKIMTLNVWSGRLERVLLKHLETLDIDFACMQEAVDYGGVLLRVLRHRTKKLVIAYGLTTNSSRH